MLQAATAHARPIPEFTIKRRLARPLAKKGSSADRLAFWQQQHSIKRAKRKGVREGISQAFRFKIVGFTKEGLPIPRLTMLAGVRIDRNGKPRSKTWSYAGRR